MIDHREEETMKILETLEFLATLRKWFETHDHSAWTPVETEVEG